MNSVAKTPISATAKFFAIFFTVFGAFHLIDYIFYGHALRNILAAIGCALVAYGNYKGGASKAAPDPRARAAIIAGVVFFGAYLVLKYIA